MIDPPLPSNASEKPIAVARRSATTKSGSTSTNILGLFQEQRLYIGQHQRVECAGTVDVPDAAGAVNEEDAQQVINRTSPSASPTHDWRYFRSWCKEAAE